jgi:hypothetical protein
MKPQPMASMHSADLRRRKHDVGAERFEHVGRARLRRDAAVAVLGYRGAGRGGDEHGGGGNVEGMRAVAAGADDVDEVGVVRRVHLGRQLAHHHRRGRDLADGFLLHAQAGEDGGDHQRRDLALHDLPHQVQHFIVEDFAVFDGALERFLGGDHFVPFRKLRRSS